MKKEENRIHHLAVKDDDILKLKVYKEPKVMKLGSMQKYTLGGSVLAGDSGQGGDFAEDPNA